jgi:hypothetical protein
MTGVAAWSGGGVALVASGRIGVIARSNSDRALIADIYGNGDAGFNYDRSIIEGHANTYLRFKVDGHGDVYADGAYKSPAADFAELMPVAGDPAGYEPGDVLAIGEDGALVLSDRPYATNVAGVYSTQPGVLGGYSDDEQNGQRVPLAIVGIVPVKVSAEDGAIRPGDLLVTSSIPGHAMRGDGPPPGTIIGKALASLETGTGVIQVLVTLQ